MDRRAWPPNLVGISTITPTVKRGYALADECRVRGIPVILGGPHVTFLPEEALAHADLVVRVSGYSSYFHVLAPEIQDEVIARTVVA